MKKTIKNIALIFSVLIVSLGLSLAIGFVLAWTEPGSAPPTGNVPTPINVGLTGQTKSGALTVQGDLTAPIFYDIQGGYLNPSGNSYFVGNVGIGTTSPTKELELRGDRGWLGNTFGILIKNTWGPSALQIDAGTKTDAGAPGARRTAAVDFKSDGALRWGIGIHPSDNPNTGFKIWESQAGDAVRFHIDAGGNVGIGTTEPGLKLEVKGDIQISDSIERAFVSRRSGTVGLRTDPVFSFGRITEGGINEPVWKIVYASATEAGRNVFEVESTGTIGSVRTITGSHFEGFITGQPEPLFRLNSYPSMQLEMGPGGVTETDVILRRAAANTLTILTGGTERVRIDSSGNVGIGTTSPGAKLEVAGQIKVTGGSPGAGKVLISDTSGLASWQLAPPAGSTGELRGYCEETPPPCSETSSVRPPAFSSPFGCNPDPFTLSPASRCACPPDSEINAIAAGKYSCYFRGIPRCGDGIIQSGEVCDDGNTVNYAGNCYSDCSKINRFTNPSHICDGGGSMSLSGSDGPSATTNNKFCQEQGFVGAAEHTRIAAPALCGVSVALWNGIAWTCTVDCSVIVDVWCD